MSCFGGPRAVNSDLVATIDPAAILSNKLLIEYLILGGGGGGGGVIGGGGGAGGLIYGSMWIEPGTYPIVIGAGGVGGNGFNTTEQDGKPGGNTTAFGFTAFGGGGGGHYGSNTTFTDINGGSGGGGSYGNASGGTAVTGQGNPGGGGGSSNLSSGGGGAGSAGGTFSNPYGGDGGRGLYFGHIFGTTYGYSGWFGAGGAGAVRTASGRIPGTAYDGGGYATDSNAVGGAGATNSGSGGGGAGYNASNSGILGGSGADGITLVRHNQPWAVSGGSSSSFGDFTIQAFTGSASLVFNNTAREFTQFSTTTLTNGALIDSSGGGSIYCDGSNDFYRIQNANINPGHMTLSFWLNINSAENWNIRFDALTGTSTGGNGRYLVYRSSGTELIFYTAFNSTVFQIPVSSANTLFTNKWNHITWITSDSNNDGIMQLYINGELYDDLAITQPYAYSNSDLYFGCDTGTARHTNMNVSAIKIYNRPLTAGEVLFNFLSQRVRFGV